MGYWPAPVPPQFWEPLSGQPLHLHLQARRQCRQMVGQWANCFRKTHLEVLPLELRALAGLILLCRWRQRWGPRLPGLSSVLKNQLGVTTAVTATLRGLFGLRWYLNRLLRFEMFRSQTCRQFGISRRMLNRQFLFWCFDCCYSENRCRGWHAYVDQLQGHGSPKFAIYHVLRGIWLPTLQTCCLIQSWVFVLSSRPCIRTRRYQGLQN